MSAYRYYNALFIYRDYDKSIYTHIKNILMIQVSVILISSDLEANNSF